MPKTYELVAYGNMMADEGRMRAYEEALRAAIQPGCTVLDIGAGCGIFSLMACRLGAGHVHAVEPSPWLETGRQLAADNGFADRIEFHRCMSTELQLAHKADVVVSDLRGVLPLLEGHLAAIDDARARLAREGASFIPARDTLWVALVEDADGYRPFERPWLANDLGFELASGHRMAVNTWRKTQAKPAQLLTQPRCWATVDYEKGCKPHVKGSARAAIERAGTAHALAVWFDAELAPGVGFSNAPAAPPLIYGQAFFPLERPLRVEAGEWLEADLRADLAGNDYIWTWNTRITQDGVQRAHLRQSTFFAQPLEAGELQRSGAQFVPRPERRMEMDSTALTLVDGVRSLEQISTELMARFPGAFASTQDAIGHIASLLDGYDAPESQ